MTIPCNRVQEEIAWSCDLSDEMMAHLLVCSECKRVAEAFTELNSIADGSLDTAVPEHFADRVMAAVKAETVRTQVPQVMAEGLLEKIEALLPSPLRLGIASFWVWVLLAFGVFLPSAA